MVERENGEDSEKIKILPKDTEVAFYDKERVPSLIILEKGMEYVMTPPFDSWTILSPRRGEEGEKEEIMECYPVSDELRDSPNFHTHFRHSYTMDGGQLVKKQPSWFQRLLRRE